MYAAVLPKGLFHRGAGAAGPVRAGSSPTGRSKVTTPKRWSRPAHGRVCLPGFTCRGRGAANGLRARPGGWRMARDGGRSPNSRIRRTPRVTTPRQGAIFRSPQSH